MKGSRSVVSPAPFDEAVDCVGRITDVALGADLHERRLRGEDGTNSPPYRRPLVQVTWPGGSPMEGIPARVDPITEARAHLARDKRHVTAGSFALSPAGLSWGAHVVLPRSYLAPTLAPTSLLPRSYPRSYLAPTSLAFDPALVRKPPAHVCRMHFLSRIGPANRDPKRLQGRETRSVSRAVAWHVRCSSVLCAR